MPNPYGNLAGITDRSEPGWQDRLLEMVHNGVAEGTRAKRGARTSTLLSSVDPEFRALLMAAAQQRDISAAAYMRRAVGAFIAADLGLELADVVRFGAEAIPFGKAPNTLKGKVDDDGKGFGSWEVKV